MPKVVLDTNVWVSAVVVPHGVCAGLVQQLTRNRWQLITSPPLLHELERVLTVKFGYPEPELRRTMAFVQSLSTCVEPTQRLNVVTAHELDNRVLECAIAAQADLIITGDTKHLIPLKQIRGIPIQLPRAVLTRLG